MTTQPTQSPAQAYASCAVPGLDPALFELSPSGLQDHQVQTALTEVSLYETAQKSHFLGYQANQYNLYGDLAQYLTLHLNNIGDPFVAGNFTLNTKFMERPVLDYFASLWNARWPHDPTDPESYWGYVLTMGSTEGNLYGLWNARDYLAGKVLLDDPTTVAHAQNLQAKGHQGPLPRKVVWHQAPVPEANPHAYTPVAFYSQDTHYSILKIMRILAIPTFHELGTKLYPGECPITEDGSWPEEVPSEGGALGPGSVDIQALTQLVAFFAAKGYPIMICFNYGTTFKGAYDDVEGACQALAPIFQKYGLESRKVVYNRETGDSDVRTGFWIHVDGALGATYMPFVEMAQAQKRLPKAGPVFDFRLPYVHSISTSGHKWVGAPFPTGLYMTKVKYQLLPPSNPAYIGSPDTTLAGSRSGIAPAVLWKFLATHSQEALMERALRCEHLADYAHKRLTELQAFIHLPLWIQRSPLALTVLFRQPSPELVSKYTLSCESLLTEDGEQRDYAHIYMMENVTEAKIDALVADLAEPGAFPTPPPVADHGVFRTAPETSQGVPMPHQGRGWR